MAGDVSFCGESASPAPAPPRSQAERVSFLHFLPRLVTSP